MSSVSKDEQKSQNSSHTDNSQKSGFGALDKIGQVDPDQATYFSYTKADGTPVDQMVRYPEASYQTNYLLVEDEPGIFHSSYAIDNFYFADRIDEFAVVDPGKKALFVDVGVYDLCGIEFLDEALVRTNTRWEDAELFLTHSHDDHDGNMHYCLDKGARCVYVGALPEFKDSMVDDYLVLSGLAKTDTSKLRFYVERLLKRASIFDGYEDRVRVVKNGDVISVGDYHFEVLETPGHTIEHLALIERDKGLLFAGDHILDTAPGLMSYFADIHLLKRFLESLEYLKTVGLKKVFMCHHDALVGTEEINGFLDKIVKSYERPVNKMLSMLEKDHPLTTLELAKKYYAYLSNWDDQPLILLTRRVAIALSYLEYLYDIGKAKRSIAEDGALEYFI